MESESGADQGALGDIHDIRAREVPVPRRHAALQLAFTVLLAAYLGVFVYTGSFAGVFAGNTMALMLPPIIIASGLIAGANERFGVRRRAGVGQRIAAGCFLGAFLGLIIWGTCVEGYPWWFAPSAAVLTLVIFGIPPLRVVVRAPGVVRVKDSPHPLSRPVRTVTVILGVYLGLSAATALVSIVSSIVLMLGMIGVIILLTARTAPWGLMRIGYEWRRPQWVGFGIAVTSLFVLAVLIVATAGVTHVGALCAGTCAAAAMLVSAFIPRGYRGTPAS